MEVQKAALSDCNILFTEKESGGKDIRLELINAHTLTKELSSKKVNVSMCVYRLNQLTRKKFTLIEEFNEYNIRLTSLQESLKTDTLVDKMLCISLGFVAEMELDNIRSRRRDGLERAKLEGNKLGNQGLPKKQKKKHYSASHFNQELYQILLYSVEFEDKKLLTKNTLLNLVNEVIDDFSLVLVTIIYLKKKYKNQRTDIKNRPLVYRYS
ncbi:recombinase family protein [Enterococcus faecalis]